MRPDFFGNGGRAGRGAISASAGRAVADNVGPSVSSSCAAFVLVETEPPDFCELSLGLLVVFLGAGSCSAAAFAEGAGAAADCEWVWTAEVLAAGAGADFITGFSGAFGG